MNKRLVVPAADIFSPPVIREITQALVVPVAPEAGGGYGVALVGTSDDVGNEFTILCGSREAAAAVARAINGRAGK